MGNNHNDTENGFIDGLVRKALFLAAEEQPTAVLNKFGGWAHPIPYSGDIKALPYSDDLLETAAKNQLEIEPELNMGADGHEKIFFYASHGMFAGKPFEAGLVKEAAEKTLKTQPATILVYGDVLSGMPFEGEMTERAAIATAETDLEQTLIYIGKNPGMPFEDEVLEIAVTTAARNEPHAFFFNAFRYLDKPYMVGAMQLAADNITGPDFAQAMMFSESQHKCAYRGVMAAVAGKVAENDELRLASYIGGNKDVIDEVMSRGGKYYAKHDIDGNHRLDSNEVARVLMNAGVSDAKAVDSVEKVNNLLKLEQSSKGYHELINR
jgi:hypothetical protein